MARTQIAGPAQRTGTYDVVWRVPNRGLAGRAGVVFDITPSDHDDPTHALSLTVFAGDDGVVFPLPVIQSSWVGGPAVAKDGITPTYEFRCGLLGDVDFLANRYLHIHLVITNGPMRFRVSFEDAT